MKTLAALNVLRLEMGDRLGLRDPGKFAPLWVVDFPLLEWDEETKRFYAMHHLHLAQTGGHPALRHRPGEDTRQRLRLRGERYRGGRRLDTYFRQRAAKPAVRDAGFSHEDAEKQFGFLMNAFKYGAPPHGGIAFGFDRFCSLFGGAIPSGTSSPFRKTMPAATSW